MHLADGGVTTAKIADDAVNNDKLANSVVASIAANTAKTSNATHTGDVTGSTSLTIANNAVTTTKIADGAVTDGKIGAGEISVNKLANGAVHGSKIADQAVTLDKLPHGTSSNDGKFLRANNGADPSFETVTSTTINNNADNRVITGSGTANTLEGESTLTYDNSNGILLSSLGYGIQNISGQIAGQGGGQDHISIKDSGGTERVVVKTHGTNIGKVGIGTSSPNSYAIATFNDSNGISLTGSTQTRIVMQHANGGTNLKNFDIQTSDGNLRFRTIGDNNTTVTERLRIQSGGGISFNGDTAAANALDDYEEGTFSPFTSTQISTHSITIPAQAHYVKIGRTCYVWFRMSFSSSSSSAIEGNMPFPCSNPTDSGSNSPFFMPTFPRSSGGVDIGFCYLGNNNSTTFTIYQSNANYATWNFNSGLSQITVNGCYRTT